jgi:hypothetical protein
MAREKLDDFFDQVKEVNQKVDTYSAMYHLFEHLFDSRIGCTHIQGRVGISKPGQKGEIQPTVVDILKDSTPYGPGLLVEVSAEISFRNRKKLYEKILPDLDNVTTEMVDDTLKDEVVMEIFHQLQMNSGMRGSFGRID